VSVGAQKIWHSASKRKLNYLIILFHLPDAQAFVVPSIGRPALLAASTGTSLDASRINAKQEKRKRNRENMRKFKKGGKKGTSKKKMMRKLQSGAARQVGGLFSSCVVPRFVS
jgi:hypothetical protein